MRQTKGSNPVPTRFQPKYKVVGTFDLPSLSEKGSNRSNLLPILFKKYKKRGYKGALGNLVSRILPISVGTGWNFPNPRREIDLFTGWNRSWNRLEPGLEPTTAHLSRIGECGEMS